MTMTRVGRTIVRTQRRARQWAQARANGTIVAATHAGQISINLLTDYEVDIGAELHNITVSALNYNISYRLTSSTTGDDTTVSMGIILVGQDALDIGGTSLPNVSSDHADWMFWDTRTLVSSRDVTDVDEMVQGGFLEVRNRSMRKMRENHQALVAIFGSSLLQPTQLQIFLAGRALILLP